MSAMTVEKPSEIAHFSDSMQGLIQEKTLPCNQCNKTYETLGYIYTPDNTYWRETL